MCLTVYIIVCYVRLGYNHLKVNCIHILSSPCLLFIFILFYEDAVKECAIWMDESSLFGHRLNNRTGPSSPMASQREDALGLKVETAV